MPEITITINTSEGQRRFGVLADALKDLTPVLREFDKFKRAKIAELFATQGHGKWPPLSASQQRAAELRQADAVLKAPQSLRVKLRREMRRAARGAKRKDARVGFLKSHLTTKGRSNKKKRWNTVARRGFVLQAFEELLESGPAASVANFESDDSRLQKSVRGLGARLERAYGRAAKKGQTLGNIPFTIRSVVKSGLLTIDSSWQSPAIRALNDGAVGGHGAKIPPRPFLFWEPEDIDELARLFTLRAMLAWRS